MGLEVSMTAHDAEFVPRPRSDDDLSLDELARRRGVRPVTSVHDMARPNLFASDEEADAFLAHVANSRQADLA
jgi:hypothetical protein